MLDSLTDSFLHPLVFFPKFCLSTAYTSFAVFFFIPPPARSRITCPLTHTTCTGSVVTILRNGRNGSVSDALVCIPFVVLSFGEATLGWGYHSGDAIARGDGEITSLRTSRIATTDWLSTIGMKHQRAYHLYPETPLYIFIRQILNQGWIIFQPSFPNADRTFHPFLWRQFMAAESAE